MRALNAILLCALTLIALALPQDLRAQDDDPGRLTRLLQESLSGAGRDVQITGFEGALSSRATIERMTIADAQGVWFTAEDIVLDWNRAALLRGQLTVNTFAAGRIEMPRLPEPEAADDDIELPRPEATPFQVPELPVSIQIGSIAAEEVVLGAPVLGEATTLMLEGSASLQRGGGDAAVDLRAERTDGQRGVIALDATYAAGPGTADVSFVFDEGADGIVASRLGIPGAPPLVLAAEGSGAVESLDIDIRLASDGEERLTGGITLRGPETAETEPGAWQAALDLSGDLTALFAPELRGFFGDEVRIAALARRLPEGDLELADLTLNARSIQLDGQATLGPDGWPRAARIDGRIEAPDGGPVILPVGEGDTRIASAALGFDYDIAEGDAWQGSLDVVEFDSPGSGADDLRLQGSGTLQPPQNGTPGELRADLRMAAAGLRLDDAEVAAALGSELSAAAQVAYTGGGPLRITDLDLDGATYGLTGDVRLSGLSAGFEADLDAALAAQDISRFGPLAGRDLGGAANVTIDGTVTPLSGAFDLRIAGTGLDLAIGEPTVDRLIAGQSTLDLAARRDETGLSLQRLEIDTPGIAAEAEGEAATAGSRITYGVELKDLSLLSPAGEGAGRARLSGRAVLDGPTLASLAVQGTLTSPPGAQAFIPLGRQGTLALEGARLDLGFDEAEGTWRAEATLSSPDWSGGYSAGVLRLDGSGTLSFAEGAALPEAAAGQLSLSAAEIDAQDPDIAAALGENLRLSTRVDYAETRGLTLSDLSLASQGASLDGRVTLAPPFDAPQARFDLRLDAPDLARFSGLAGRRLQGGATLTASGTAAPVAGTFDIAADGRLRGTSLGDPALDGLLGGSTTLSVEARRNAEGRLTVPRLRIDNPNLAARASGDDSAVDYSLRLADVGTLAPDFSGPATLEGTAQAVSNGWRVAADATGPGGTAARIEGLVANDFRLDLSLRGNAPLGLANVALTPRRIEGTARFDLRVAGPPQLSSVSGQITTQGARLTAPTLRLTFEAIDGSVTLDRGRATLDVTTRSGDGGRISASGSLALSAPFQGDIGMRIDGVVLRDPQLYETSVNGTISVSGPLAGGALITGDLSLPRAEIRVPSSTVSTLGALPDVRHVAPPPAVRRTLSYAGLTTEGTPAGQNGGGGPPARPYPLDITISAPSQIFVRGRGLDAELGGTLRITGTTANPIPQGGFELVRGRLDLLGQRFQLSEGVVRIEGDFNPYLRLVVTTERDEVQVSIIVEGQANDPQVSFASSPPLPEDEVLAQLLFERSIEDLSALQLVQLANGVATLTGRGNGALAGLRTGLGLDDLDITQGEDGGAALRVGKYLSENVYTDVTVESGGRSEVNLNLDLTRSVTVRGGVSNEGDSSLGVFFERDY
ncbi:translocation/assembly module TamB domain-containing protein [Rhodosalinus sp.]|uniref:translocation/assembly module TamB domain-containing protein n=1 Tax=Rhodosalinus sp. TaxID=2047741 RepID=UPI00397E8DE5